MTHANSPKVTMENEGLPPSLFESKAQEPYGRRWNCPDDHTIAAYVDGRLGDKKARLEAHLSKCERCRSAVAGVVRMQRGLDQLPDPPLEVVQRAIQFAPDH